MSPVVYVPINLGNPERNEAQKRLIKKMQDRAWYSTGALQFRNGHETGIEVIVMTRNKERDD